MRRRLLRASLLVIFLLVGSVRPSGGAHAEKLVRQATWTRCVTEHSRRSCHTYPMPREHRPVLGHWRSCTTNPGWRVCVTYPTFTEKKAVRGYWARYWLTGYAVCDTPGFYMADGTPVNSMVGQYGAAATDPGYPGGLEFGTRVLIPSLGRTVTIHDRGASSYFDAGPPATYHGPHIDVYAGPDCTIFGNFRGLGSHYEDVFVYTA